MKKASQFTVGKNILDVGCELGNILSFLSEDVKYVGLNVDEASLDIAKNRFYRQSNPKFIKCEVGAEKIPININQKFDSIIMSAFIEHVDNRKQILIELLKYLVRDGRIILTTPTPKSRQISELGVLLKLLRREAIQEHHDLLFYDTLSSLADEVGLFISYYETFLFGFNQLAVLKVNK